VRQDIEFTAICWHFFCQDINSVHKTAEDLETLQRNIVLSPLAGNLDKKNRTKLNCGAIFLLFTTP
jgi:hypothetical protein